MPQIELGFTAHSLLVALLIVVAGGLAAFFYRYTLPPVSRARRILLTSLRGIALALLLSLLFEPFINLTTSSSEPPVLAVLIDNSRSMSIVDRSGDRASQLRTLLNSDALNRATRDGALRLYTFGSTLTSIDRSGVDSLDFREELTDISTALRMLSTERERLNIHAAVLLTDGEYNIGQNPVHDAGQLDIPLYTIGIGDSTDQKDIVITKVATNELVYSETSSPVDVTIKSSGFEDERVEVRLMEGGKELARQTLGLGTGTREYPVRLSYIPEGEGTKRFTVRVSSLPGELTSENNTKMFFARVLRSRLRVIILAGGPSPDVSIIKQTLREDRNITVSSFVQRLPDGFYEGTLTKAAIDSADCILLTGFPTAGTTGGVLDLVRAAFLQDSKPVFFVAGKDVDETRLDLIRPALPFSTASVSLAEQYVFFQPSDAQRSNPILMVNSSPDVWTRMPPIFKTHTVYRAKPEATVLGNARIQAVTLSEPLILTRSVNRQKSLAILGYGIWRWRLMAQGNPETAQALSAFLVNGIKWLTTREESRPVKVTPVKEMFSQGEPVEFVGQVYDGSARPVDNADLRVVVQSADREYETIMRQLGSGRYEGTIEGLSAGDYTFRAVAQTDGQRFGEDRGRFTIGELNLEFQDTRMNVQLLRQLASRTGGRYFTPSSVDEFESTLSTQASFAPREVTRTSSVALWNWQYTLALIVLLLSVEWFLRKRSGML